MDVSSTGPKESFCIRSPLIISVFYLSIIIMTVTGPYIWFGNA